MSTLVTYLKSITTANEDGTVSITTDSRDIATLTIRGQSIVAATYGEVTGNQAVSLIRLADITHMEFWKGITSRKDVQRMISINTEIDAMAPIEDPTPEGANIGESSTQVDHDESVNTTDSTALGDDSSQLLESEEQETQDAQLSASEQQESDSSIMPEAYHVSDEDQETLENHLILVTGPVAGMILEDAIAQAQSDSELVSLIAEELPSEEDIVKFKALTNELFNLYLDI